MGCSWQSLKVALFIFTMASCSRTLWANPRTNVVKLSCSSMRAVSGAVLATNFIGAMNNLSTLINAQGFGTAAVGDGPNAVFALAQCFGDLNATDCTLCYSEIRSILPKCYPNIGGMIFFDGCFGRYENFSFFNESTGSEDLINCSRGTNSSQPNLFVQDLRSVVDGVGLEAVKKKGFAVRSGSMPNSTIYAMAQCWENLEKRTCNSCLQTAAASIISCSPGVEARSLHAGCYMRYSNSIFWNPYDTSSSSGGTPKVVWVIVALAFGGILLLSAIGIWKMRSHLPGPKSRSSLGLSAAISSSKLNIRYQELRKATNNFDLSNKLGQGSNGTVYRGVLRDGREVAVKRLFLNTRHWTDQFFNEVDLINQVHHKNLVKLLACSVDGPESLLVYEYYFNRSLDHFIFDANRAKLLDWTKRIGIIQGVAEGLSYLHEESEIRIIHRDIKASNILLDDNFKPKITDFGLARSFALDKTHLSTGVAGTLGYMAPEYVVHGHLTEKADVYSFGVLLLEIVTGQRCNGEIGEKPKDSFLAKIWNEYKANTLERVIDGRIREGIIEDESSHMIHVGLLCTQANPSYRPTMAKVVELLKSNTAEEGVFPTEPPFLDLMRRESQGDSESPFLLSGISRSFSGSSGSSLFPR